MVYENIDGNYQKVNSIYRNVGGIINEINKRYEYINGISNLTFQNKKITYLIKDGVIKVPFTLHTLVKSPSSGTYTTTYMYTNLMSYESNSGAIRIKVNSNISAYGTSHWYHTMNTAVLNFNNKFVTQNAKICIDFLSSGSIYTGSGSYSGLSGNRLGYRITNGMNYNNSNVDIYDNYCDEFVTMLGLANTQNTTMSINTNRKIYETKIGATTFNCFHIGVGMYARYTMLYRLNSGSYYNIYNLYLEEL